MSKYGVLKKNKDSCLVPQFLWAATQGTPLKHLALVARAVCIPGSHGMAIISKTVLGRLTPLEQCMDSKLRHTPQFSVETSLLVLDFGLRGRHEDCAHLEATEELARNVDRGGGEDT